MCFIRFLDLKNIGLDIITTEIGALRGILWTKSCFMAAILNFSIFGGNGWSDVVVPAIFEIGIPKNPLGQIVMLLSESARPFHISAMLKQWPKSVIYISHCVLKISLIILPHTLPVA